MHWSGQLDPAAKSLSGNSHVSLNEGGAQRDLSEPLNFIRQNTVAVEKPRPAVSYSAAIAPVSAQDMESVLKTDLAEEIASGELAPSTGQGVSIGVYKNGVSSVFSLGAAKPDSIFEIGPITKVFTGLLLAQMAQQREVQLDEPVRELLSGSIPQPAGSEITLLDLATQQSGLPAMPGNISTSDLAQPYADYHNSDLLAYLERHGVANPTRSPSNFSSLGFGLLGVALANHNHSSFSQLFEEEIAQPLGLSDTNVFLSSEQQARLISGHNEYRKPAQPWQSDSLAGAIALRSTAKDMLTFLVANLHPGDIAPNTNSIPNKTLAAAIRDSLVPRATLSEHTRIGLGWLYQDDTGNYWHNGATAAHSAYAFFNPQGNFAAVVLFNGSPGVNGSFVENLGRHVYQRLAGKPTLSVRPGDIRQ
jgi:CubicO group peptidase (beta-lactamase class C family)